VESVKIIASLSISLFCFFCFFVVSAQAATAVSLPRFIRVSRRVKDDTWKPLTGITGITLAAEQEGGAPLFLETQNVQLDAAGRFTVLLGATKSQG
jgi:hypothetical protein